MERLANAPEKNLFGQSDNKFASDLTDFMELIRRWRKELLSGKGLAKKVRSLMEEINYFDHLLAENQKNDKAARFKMLNVERLLDSMDSWEKDPDNFEGGLFNYLNRITLLARDDLDDDAYAGKVNLMTIHAAKGLEFPVVFIAGAEENLIPHARVLDESEAAGNAEEAVEEERRLFYVAITRARDKLYITSCAKRRRLQAVIDCGPSRFIAEIPPGLVEYHDPARDAESVDATELLAAMKKRFSG
jgi:DNA helicase-2/ATP-dependent DNA helicase PcrA